MTRHERMLAELEQLAREMEEKLSPEEWVRNRLRWEDWKTLREQGVGFAQEGIRRRKCPGVLPQGYDAEAVCNEVIAEMMEGKCRLPMGFTRERVVEELKRLVNQKVRVLHRLKETRAVRSEWEGEAVNGQEGESVLVNVPAQGESVEDAVCQHEEERWRERVLEGFAKFLEPEPELRAIFRCLCAGKNESKLIARQLGVEESVVVKARKKLARRAGEFERRWNGVGTWPRAQERDE